MRGGTQRRALPRHHSEGIKYKFKRLFHFLEWESNLQPVAFTNHILRPCATTGLNLVA